MKRFLLFSFIFSWYAEATIAQEKKPIFIGLQPGITQEKFYEKDEFDVNIIPIVLELPLSKRMDLRFTTIANYHFGDEKQKFSDIGFQVLTPVFFRKKELVNERSHGFYIAPIAGYGRNLIYEHSTYLVGIEPGYLFSTKKKFTLSLGVQFGGSYFDYDVEKDKWVQHFGVKLNLGFWI